LLLGGAIWMMARKDEAPAPVAKPAVTASAAATPVPAAAAHLGINAYPWAKVTSIRNLDNGQSVELRAPLVTPAPIELPPGRYEVTLSNPNFDEPIRRTVAVEAGREETLNVPFSDPKRAALPDFGGTR
jgi:hypothetical protein